MSGTYVSCWKMEAHQVAAKGADLDLLWDRYMFLQNELDRLLQDRELMRRLARSENLRSKGKFRDEMQELTSHPYKKWDHKGAKAHSFRFLTEQVRALLLSLDERTRVARVCEEHGWEWSQSLWDDLHERGLYPRQVEVKNVCRSGKIPEPPTSKPLVMDWSTQDNTVRVKWNAALVRVDRTWIRFEIPRALRRVAVRISKPQFVVSPEDGLMYVMLPFEAECPETPLDETPGVGGYDWGRKVPVSCAAVYEDGSYSPQYVGTREGERLHRELERIDTELDVLYRKSERIGDLLAGRYDAAAYRKWGNQRHMIGVLRNKRSRVREHAARVDARDVVLGFMVATGVDELRYEDLSDMDDPTRTHMVGLIQEGIGRCCERLGFSAVPVGFRDSSRTDPFSGEEGDPGFPSSGGVL